MDDIRRYIRTAGIDSLVDFIGTVNGAKKKRLLLSSNIFIMPFYYVNEG